MDKEKFRKLLKNKKFMIVAILILIGIICLLLLKGFFYPNGSVSKYGNRLDGIKNIEFDKGDKDKIIKSINSNEKVDSAKMNVHGRIINIIFNVNKDTSVDDARNIANESLNNFSSEVKGFYDIEFIITMNDEEGIKEQVTNDDGQVKEVVTKLFPIMGYKNSSSEGLVW